jgi:hypothetical protein
MRSARCDQSSAVRLAPSPISSEMAMKCSFRAAPLRDVRPGLSSLLLFYLPRPALLTLARRRRLRATFAPLRRPVVAVLVYVAGLYTWHLSLFFEAALRSELVHGLPAPFG